MSKRPFGKILKPKKQQQKTVNNIIQSEQPTQQNFSSNNPISKPTTINKLRLDSSNKVKKNIYDAVKKIDEEKQVTTTSNSAVLKPTLNFKKNLGTKMARNSQLNNMNINMNLQNNHNNNQSSTNNNNNNNDQLQDSSQNIQKPQKTSIARPTPVFNRNKGKLLLGNNNKAKQIQKQKPIIQQEYNPLDDYGMNNNRLVDPSQQQQKEYLQKQEYNNRDANVNNEEKQKKIIKPTLFNKKNAGLSSNNTNNNINSNQHPQQQQKLLNNSQVYQQYDKSQPMKQKFNFQKMLNIQNTEINIQNNFSQSHTTFQPSNYKIQKQQKRTKQLSSLLNLQQDLFESTLSINSTTSFQVYINKIKSGFLKNSSDQAYDEKNEAGSQTVEYGCNDFTNQCPQDYQQAMNGGNGNIYEQSQQDKFNNFMLNIGPIIEQLIKPSKQVIMPPISLLAFNPVFVKYVCCPNPIFIYYSQQHNLSLLVINQKLFITQDQVCSILDMNGIKIVGLKNGKLVLFTGQNNRSSRLYQKIFSLLQSHNFQLASFITNQYQKLSLYFCDSQITSIIKSDNSNNEFYILTLMCKIIKYQIIKDIKKKIILQPIEVIEIEKILQKKYILGYGMKKRADILYINTSSGLVLYNITNSSVMQKISSNITKIKQFYLPKRSQLIYCLISNEYSIQNSLRIYSLQYQQYIREIRIDEYIREQNQNNNNMNNNMNDMIQQLIIPQIQHDNRQISLFYCVYIVYKNGNVYEIKLDNSNNQIQCTRVYTNIQTKIRSKKNLQNQQQQSKQSLKNNNIIYHGINILSHTNQIQTIKLYKDLKCVTELLTLKVNMQKNVNNLKSILMKNKNFTMELNEMNVVFV